MKRVITYVGAGLLTATAVVAVATSVFAWHPVGVIKKEVQNVTQNSALKDANSESDAVAAKTGDTLKYVITVKNNGEKHSAGHNDMHFTKVTDTLPAGVELVSGDTNKDLGRINAGESKKYEFTVKVTSTTKGQVICNTASFTGDSEVKDQPQKGQDKACIKVDVPETPKPVENTIDVCRLSDKKYPVTIKESEFDATKHSKNADDCKDKETPKPVEKTIKVCVVDTKEVKTIKESAFDSKTMTRDEKDCKETPAPVTPETPKAATPAEELPETGVGSVFGGMVGLGSLAAAGTAYFRSRR